MNKLYHAIRQIVSGGNNGLPFFVVVLSVFFISVLLSSLFYKMIVSITKKFFNKIRLDVDSEDFLPAKKPLRMFFVATLTYIALYYMTSRLSASNSSYIVIAMFSKHIYRAIMIVIIAWILYHFVPIILSGYLRFNPTSILGQNPVIIGFAVRSIQLVSIFIAIIVILSEMGINVNGFITGLGLGGLTFALAAQDTASNLFGGVVILSDKPFSVGDWIQTPEVEGVVEGISFRSTRVRTFDDALVVLPNSKLSNSAITNWTKMNKRKIRFFIGLTYSTEPNTLRKIIEEMTNYLTQHEDVIHDSVIVRLDGFGVSSLDILIQAYLDVTALSDMKRIQEQINYEILRIVADNDASFALPSTSIYMGK